jgi:hypothetical protein
MCAPQTHGCVTLANDAFVRLNRSAMFIQAMMLTFQKQQQSYEGAQKEQVNAQLLDLLERINRERLTVGTDTCHAFLLYIYMCVCI